jgi:hypothetical protein
MAKKAKSAKKSKTAKNKSKKAVKKSLVAAVSGRAGHPDKRLPIHGDPDRLQMDRCSQSVSVQAGTYRRGLAAVSIKT